MIQTTRLLFFSALFSAEDGDVGGAITRLVTGLKFTPLMAREGTLIAFLVSLADTRILSQTLGEVWHGKALEDKDLVRLMSAQDPGPWRERLAAAFRGERVLFIEAGPLVWRETSRISVPFSKARAGGGTSASGSSGPSLRGICAELCRASSFSRPRQKSRTIRAAMSLGPGSTAQGTALVRVPVQDDDRRSPNRPS